MKVLFGIALFFLMFFLTFQSERSNPKGEVVSVREPAVKSVELQHTTVARGRTLDNIYSILLYEDGVQADVEVWYVAENSTTTSVTLEHRTLNDPSSKVSIEVPLGTRAKLASTLSRKEHIVTYTGSKDGIYYFKEEHVLD